ADDRIPEDRRGDVPTTQRPQHCQCCTESQPDQADLAAVRRPPRLGQRHLNVAHPAVQSSVPLVALGIASPVILEVASVETGRREPTGEVQVRAVRAHVLLTEWETEHDGHVTGLRPWRMVTPEEPTL